MRITKPIIKRQVHFEYKEQQIIESTIDLLEDILEQIDKENLDMFSTIDNSLLFDYELEEAMERLTILKNACFLASTENGEGE